MSFAITSENVLIDNELIEATIIYSNESGKILEIIKHRCHHHDEVLKVFAVTSFKDVSPYIVMPGLVDSHVHLNEPGRTEWEGFVTGTQAAASGGVTTVIDMPLNAIPPTTTVENFLIKIDAAKNKCWVNVGFWGGIIPNNLQDLKPLISMGVRGFKSFLCESGVEEFPAITPSHILKVMKHLQSEKTLLMFHAEMEPPQSHSPVSLCKDSENIDQQYKSIDPTAYSSYLASRPDSFELTAIAEIIACSQKYPTIPLHIVHLATHQAIPMLIEAKKKGLPITAETCFHYLSLYAENISSGSTHFKCCPPIRTDENRKLLWDALRQDVITTVVSDHSPCTPELKGLERGDFFEAWGGISSVGLGLSILFTQGQKLTPKISIQEINKWCSRNTAQQVGLEHCKGQLKVGYDADIVIFDPNSTFVLKKDELYFKNKLTVYEGMEFNGKIIETIVGGNSVFNSNTGFSKNALGKLILDPRK